MNRTIIINVTFILHLCNGCPKELGCIFKKDQKHLSCFGKLAFVNETSLQGLQERLAVNSIEICNFHATVLHLKELVDRFPNVTNLTIFRGNIAKIKGRISPNNHIEVLVLKNLSIEQLPERFLEYLKGLQVLDLRGNLLEHLNDKLVNRINKIPHIYLSENTWRCYYNIDWIFKINSTLVEDFDSLKCHGTPYPNKSLYSIAKFIQNIEANCPKNCDCSMPDVVRDPTTSNLEPIIEVNCTNTNLHELPPILPMKTKILFLEKNKIANLDPLINNPYYKNVQDLYLDDNLIGSIRNLEGSFWFSQFRVLSLRRNKLIQLPTYALDNALQQNPNMPSAVRIYLGGNPWRCDCTFTPSFQDILRKYQNQIHDIEDVRCSPNLRDETILELSRSSICRNPEEYSLLALDILNIILASLIVLILGKLAYDYYHFKKTGRLPWIVTKMP